MRSDHQLQRTVLDQLDFEPSINCSHICVLARDGVVALIGHVASLDEKRASAVMAGQVPGVRAVVDDIVIELPGRCQSSDGVIAQRRTRKMPEVSAPKPHDPLARHQPRFQSAIQRRIATPIRALSHCFVWAVKGHEPMAIHMEEIPCPLIR